MAAAPAGEGWREEIAQFADPGGGRLVGILTLPTAAEQPRCAVVILHGWGTCRTGPHRMLAELGRELAARAGAAALRFDFSGRGDSGGEFWTTDLDAMIGEARAAGEWLLGRTGAGRLAAAGLCSGANVALGAAAADGRFAAAAALSALPFQKQRRAGQAAARARGTFRELLAKAARAETWRRALRGEIGFLRILRRIVRGEGGASARALNNSGPSPRRNLKDSRRDIQAELGRCRARLLFVHGGADAEGLSGWREVFEPFLAAAGVNCRHLVAPGADHDYHDLAAKRMVIDAVVELVQETQAAG